MANALHYKSNLRDILFNVFEVHQTGTQVLGQAPFGSMDEESARDALTALEEVARLQLAASFHDADRQPLTQSADGSVLLPASLKKTLKDYQDSGWHLLELPESMGGYGAPPSVIWAAFEMVAGANPTAAFYVFGTFIAKVIDRLGTPAQKAMAQDALDRWWWPSLMMFGPPDGESVHSAQSMRWKIKQNSNDELRQKFVDQTVPQAQWLGLTVPDPDLKWNEATGHWNFGAIDWSEFHRVLAGDGPCNRQRLRTRVAAHENGQWVRDAANAYAAKHGKQAA